MKVKCRFSYHCGSCDWIMLQSDRGTITCTNPQCRHSLEEYWAPVLEFPVIPVEQEATAAEETTGDRPA